MPTPNQLRATLRKKTNRVRRMAEEQQTAAEQKITVCELRARRAQIVLSTIAKHETISHNYFRPPISRWR